MARVKQVAKMQSGHTPDKKVPEYWVDCDIPWISLNDTSQLKRVDYISETAICINAKGMANSSAHLLPANCVVFTRDATIGLAAITTRPMAVSQHVIAWVCNPSKISPEFLLWVFYAMKGELERFTFGATLKTIGMPDVKRLTTPVPPLQEQAQIARFLAYQTARIDALVDKQQQLIELLKEKRQAVISHAVTKGLDPKAPMRDSGIEWLGQVPAHWTVKRLKHISPRSGWSW
ncbi:MAG: restriction endonuclease subunit S [Polyangiaceae bacterium]